MANLNETDEWFAGIYQLEEDDPVLGGPAGIDNLAPRQLASRSLYQRLRSVTPWSALLAYPADTAYVSHAGTTWKSGAASTGVQPGTDETKWTRWAHTAAELASLLDDQIAAHKAETDPHDQYALWATLAAVIAGAGMVPARDVPSQLMVALRKWGVVRGFSRFTTSGSMVVPEGVTKMLADGCGAGGGGGAGASGTSATGSGGGGGGAGMPAIHQVLTVVPGETLTATIASAGAGGSTNSAAGGSGGTTTLVGSVSGVLLTLSGGAGGAGGNNTGGGSPGGLGGSGYPRGSDGQDSTGVVAGGAPGGNGGAGASGPFGGGGGLGRGGSASGLPGGPAYGYGAGGAGGGGYYVPGVGTFAPGSAGAPGFLSLQW